MFKIKIYDSVSILYRNQTKKGRYSIIYEQIPDISKGIENRKIHSAKFDSKTEAFKFCDQLSEFLTDVSFHCDLIYSYLNRIEFTNLFYQNATFNFSQRLLELHEAKNRLLKQSVKTDTAFNHINAIINYIDSMKILLLCVKKSSKTEEQIFKNLLQLEGYFIETYRNAQQLFERNSLKFLS